MPCGNILGQMSKLEVQSVTFGERLKAERVKRGLTTSQVARDLGFAQGTISKFENDIKEPSKGSLVALAKYYNVSLDYLVGNIGAN